MAQARTARYKRCVILSPQMEHALRTFVVVNPQSSAEDAARHRLKTPAGAKAGGLTRSIVARRTGRSAFRVGNAHLVTLPVRLRGVSTMSDQELGATKRSDQELAVQAVRGC